MQLGDKIARLRKRKGLTQEELANRTNLTVRTIQRIEANASTPQSFSLKAIARALDLEYEDLVTAATAAPVNLVAHSPEDQRHFLQFFTLSCFSYLVIPWVHFLIPLYLLKKKPGISAEAIAFARKVIRQQIYWVILLHLLILLVLAYNIIAVKISGNKQLSINFLWPFFTMYLLNAILLFRNKRQIQSQF